MSATTRIAIIGCGNMGAALAVGLSGLKEPAVSLTGFDPDAAKLKSLAAEAGLTPAASPLEAAKDAEIIFLCVKPKFIASVAADLTPGLKPSQVLVSIAAGINADDIRAASCHACPVVRTMPTTTLLVQEGLFAVVFDDPKLSTAQTDLIRNLLASLGKVYELKTEAEISAFTAVAGSGPGFMFQLWMGYVEGAVRLGFTRPEAVDMVLRVSLGSAKLALESGKSLYDLYSMVASPAGTTVAGTLHLERNAVRGHIADALIASFERSEALGRKS